MIKFFRKIRYNLMSENKTGKYFKYAIGEIVLVVIGILIALSINNWNENRKQNLKQKALLTKFSQDLLEDHNNYKTYLNEISQTDALHQHLFDIVLKGDTLYSETPELIRRSVFFNPVSKDNNPNITTEIENDDIRKSIQIYFKAINETRNSVMEYRAIVVEIRNYLRKEKVHDFADWANGRQFTNVISAKKLSRLANEKFFQQLLFEASLKLNEVDEELNKLLISNKSTQNSVLKYL